MPRVKMLVLTAGSEDGIHVRRYEKDREYEINDRLAGYFSGMGAATIIRERKMAPGPSDNKMMEGSSANKQSEQDEAETEKQPGVRIFQLADELGVPLKKILAAAKDLGIEVSGPSSEITLEEAAKIRAKLGK